MTSLASLAQRLVARAINLNMTIATAESCTAGALAVTLADSKGGGIAFQGGFVVYTKANKTAALGVPSELISDHTAVSGPVAEAMAKGVLDRTPADLGIAVTGVAGPDPDEDGNPVGLMHIAVSVRGQDVVSCRCDFGIHERDQLRIHAMSTALTFALEALERKTREDGGPLA